MFQRTRFRVSVLLAILIVATIPIGTIVSSIYYSRMLNPIYGPIYQNYSFELNSVNKSHTIDIWGQCEITELDTGISPIDINVYEDNTYDPIFTLDDFIYNETVKLKIDIESSGFIEFEYAGNNCTVSLSMFDGQYPPTAPRPFWYPIPYPILIIGTIVIMVVMVILWTDSHRMIHLESRTESKEEDYIELKMRDSPFIIGIIAFVGVLLISPIIIYPFHPISENTWNDVEIQQYNFSLTTGNQQYSEENIGSDVNWERCSLLVIISATETSAFNVTISSNNEGVIQEFNLYNIQRETRIQIAVEEGGIYSIDLRLTNASSSVTGQIEIRENIFAPLVNPVYPIASAIIGGFLLLFVFWRTKQFDSVILA
ncbi:MAG: membrane protein of unknown function [Candidatus Thorarchaeota archaeon]|nr:MAG: membrane protein of unknown function [Candidatus Thorarchaeota archaeon]